MKVNKIMIFISFMILILVNLTTAQTWQTVYETDFSSDPGWLTSNSALYYWDLPTQTYFTDNYTNSGTIDGDWATTDITYSGESFRLIFDVKPTRTTGDNGDVCIGLFGPNRESHSGTEERIFLLIGGYYNEIYLEGHNSGGEIIQTPESIAKGCMVNNEWHHVEITYDATTEVISGIATINGATVFNWSMTMNYGFSNSLLHLGASVKGSWATAGRHQVAYIDNVTFSLDAGVIPVAFDIKPGSCPNPLNIKPPKYDESGDYTKTQPGVASKTQPLRRRGVLPGAILGTDDFDVTQIDPNTLMLEGVSPIRWDFEDVATPVGEDAEECDCNSTGGDGETDLTLKFDRGDIIAALGEVSDGDMVPLAITGQLYDGTPFEGTDCVLIIGPKEDDNILAGNFPNPFNPATEICFDLPNACDVRLEIFNIMGQKVTTLVDQRLETGSHTARWNAGGNASGVYLYKITAGDIVETRKMVLLK